MKREMTLTNLLGQTADELRDKARIVAIFFAIMVPLNAVMAYFDSGGGGMVGLSFLAGQGPLTQGALVIAVTLTAMICSIVLTYWMYAAMVHQTTSPGFGRFWPWLGIYILSSLGIMFGFLLIVVPGLILMVRWVMVLPLVVKGEIPAMDAFGESSSRGQGYGWSIFGAGLIILIVYFVMLSVVAGGALFVGQASSFAGAAVTAIAETAGAAIFIAFAVGAYRLSQDDTQEITDVFA